MSFIRRPALILSVAALVFPLHSADDQKADKKSEVPTVTMAVPFAVVAGTTNRIVIRGLSLTNASAIRFPGVSQKPTAEITSRGKATVPDKGDPKKLGDTQLEVQLVLPDGFPPGDLPFAVDTAEGDTNTNLLHVVSRELLFDEKEPNGGFRKPNEIASRQTVRGVIGDANDVDVFRFKGKAGQRISVKTKSAAYGSLLDALVTLYDCKGHGLATSDDADGLEARLIETLPADGDYFLCINDAHDRGGAAYGYLIEIAEGKAELTR